jgi:hypothetical protein
LDRQPHGTDCFRLVWVGHMLYPDMNLEDAGSEARDFCRRLYLDPADD